jgi:hypothetical protein
LPGAFERRESWSVSDRLRAEITFECEQIEELLRKYSRLLGRLSGARQLPHGDFWHTDLLESMAHPATGAPVISGALRDRLKPYLHFRHVFRSAYVLMLQWDKMEPLVEDLAGTSAQLKSELRDFVDRAERGPVSHA